MHQIPTSHAVRAASRNWTTKDGLEGTGYTNASMQHTPTSHVVGAASGNKITENGQGGSRSVRASAHRTLCATGTESRYQLGRNILQNSECTNTDAQQTPPSEFRNPGSRSNLTVAEKLDVIISAVSHLNDTVEKVMSALDNIPGRADNGELDLGVPLPIESHDGMDALYNILAEKHKRHMLVCFALSLI